VRRVALLVAISTALAAWAAVGFGAPVFPPPAITASPPSLSSARSATFTYTDAQAISSFECSLDGAAFARCGTTRPASKTYNGLSDGPHAFRVRAVSGTTTSDATSYAWTVDATPPRVVSIVRTGPTPTNAATVAWTVTFTEDVTGVAAASFSLVGSGGVTSVAGSGSSYTVSASTGADGTLQLRLTSAGAIRDAAGNALAGLPANGQTYTVDRTPPATPTIASGPPQLPDAAPSTQARFRFTGEAHATFLCRLDGGAPAACSSPAAYAALAQGAHVFAVRARDAAGNESGDATRVWVVDTVPPDPPALTQTPDEQSTSQSATFAWTDSDTAPSSGIASDRCKLDGGAYAPCSSPWTYTGLSFASHTFSVEARDHAGNTSQAATFTWTVVRQGVPFTIAGDAAGLLYPGAPFTALALTITNPNTVPIYVTGITVTVGGGSNACPATSLEVQQSPASTTNALRVPARATNWPVPAAFEPKVRLVESGTSQDACRNRTFTLGYSGSAHS